tara:strand:- start:544 stop:837 length:294 start_codon:yes stop_codon:yes gene_type:complete
MTVKVLAEFNCADGNADKFIEICQNIFPVTREFHGCSHIDISAAQEDPNRPIMTENWAPKEHHLKYLEYRTNDGNLEKLVALLASPPEITYFDLSDA